MIPVSIVTGFLGSGKTTLICRILRDPAFRRTAIIVSEFGEIGLDHELIAVSDDSIITLNTGCLCCRVQSDLTRTLTELYDRRGAGVVDYDRVLIETSGLSDPTSTLQSLMTDGWVSAAHRVSSVVTVVDAVHGERTLLEHAEGRRQVALADRIVLSKTDLRPPSDRLLDQLDTLNAAAPRMTNTEAAPSVLFGDGCLEGMAERLASTRHPLVHSEIETFTVIRERPLPALVLTLLLQAIAEHCGSRLLRLKGLVGIEEIPAQPAVIHGIGHVVSPLEFLERWPSGDERTRIVVISKGVPRYLVPRLLDAIEEEVRDAITVPG